MNENVIQVLVIGKSGHGKSEFILSLIKDEHRQLIPASGEGQTTRTSMEYNIFNKSDQALKISVKLKEREQFIDERIERLKNFFCEKETKTELFDNECFRKLFYKQLLLDSAFFNIEEFSESTKKEIEKAYNQLFDTKNINFKSKENSEINDEVLKCPIDNDWYASSKKLLSKEDAEKIEVETVQINEDDSGNQKNEEAYILQDLIENFYTFSFGKCRNELENYIKEKKIDLKDISELGSKEIAKFLKTQKDKNSFSSLVNTICIEAALTEQYKALVTELNIEKITLVDTYGLDHADQMTSKILKPRYKKLFRQDYPKISSVLYVRDIANTDSPSELKINIPTIFEVAPYIVSFVIFSKIDKLDSVDITEKKAYENIEDICDDIEYSLGKSGVSKVLIDNRIELLKKSRFGYASKLSDNKKNLLETNTKSLLSIFKSIINKEHLGTQFVSIDKLMAAKGTVLKGRDVFVKENDLSFYGWPGRTLGAIGSRLRNGILGFSSSTMGSTLWSDEITDSCNRRFKNMTNAYKWIEYFGSENILPTLEELFIEFSKQLCLCQENTNFSTLNYSDGTGYCKDCSNENICIKSILYQNKKNEINQRFGRVSSWLTLVYCFSECAEKGLLDDAISQLFDMHLIFSARTHNALRLAMTFSEDDAYEDIKKKYDDFFKLYDSKLDDGQRKQFECIVNSYRA